MYVRHNDIFDTLALTAFSRNIGCLKNGIVKVSKNNVKAPYTILLVGETGVGKSSVLELIANVLAGNDTDNYNFNILDHTNEEGRPSNQSQTSSAHMYELKSKNGIVVSTNISEHRECA